METATCRCGKEFVRAPHSPNHKWCSQKCCKAYHYIDNKERYEASRAKHAAAHSGSEKYYKEKAKWDKLQDFYAYKNAWNRGIVVPSRRKTKTKNRERMNQYKLRFGCLNPECQWKGAWEAGMLEFHHIDKASKTFNVGSLGDSSENRIAEEVAKCTLVCANCHRRITWGTLDASTLPPCPPY